MSELVIGRVRTAFGLTGEVKIDLYGGDFSYLQTLERVIVQRGTVRQAHTIASARELGTAFLVKFDGVDTPEEAKALRNAELVVSRADASPASEGEYYYADLMGLAVLADGQHFGTVTDILEGNGAVFLEATVAGGSKRLIPFSAAFVEDVDLDDRSIVVSTAEILE